MTCMSKRKHNSWIPSSLEVISIECLVYIFQKRVHSKEDIIVFVCFEIIGINTMTSINVDELVSNFKTYHYAHRLKFCSKD